MAGELDYIDPKWNFEERVQRLMNKWHMTRAEAEETVKRVIRDKESASIPMNTELTQ